MPTPSITHINCLSLLALKVAPNVFDLSSGMHHVSIRDQMVRAQLLVQDLIKADGNLTDLVIVGASVAGLSAALVAAEQGVRVVVLEAADEPFSLFRGRYKRFVGPYMYEWPSHFFDEQSYPSNHESPWFDSAVSPLSWDSQKPCSANDLALSLTQSLCRELRLLNNPNLEICVGMHKVLVRRHVKQFATAMERQYHARSAGWPLPNPHTFTLHNATSWTEHGSNPLTSLSITPQYLLLAAGMGRENLDLVRTDSSGQPYVGPQPGCWPFWADDTLLDAGTKDTDVAIFGGGDGALQDVLRALTGREHPLMLLEELKRNSTVMQALEGVVDELLALDRQSRQLAGWRSYGHDYRRLDEACREIAETLAKDPLVVQHVGTLIRWGSGSVTLVVRDRHFGKTYQLNRFLVHLIWACAQSGSSTRAGRMGLDIRFESTACDYRVQTGCHEVDVLCNGSVTTLSADTIAVRYGIEPSSVPGGQMIQLSPVDSGQRTTLARVELPFVMEQ